VKKLALELDDQKIVVVNISGRGDKDINTVAAIEGITV
jgi:tryptophan synthase beta chain